MIFCGLSIIMISICNSSDGLAGTVDFKLSLLNFEIFKENLSFDIICRIYLINFHFFKKSDKVINQILFYVLQCDMKIRPLKPN